MIAENQLLFQRQQCWNNKLAYLNSTTELITSWAICLMVLQPIVWNRIFQLDNQ